MNLTFDTNITTFSASALAALTISEIKSLTSTQLSSLVASQLGELTATQVSVLPVEFLLPEALTGIATNSINGITIKNLMSDQIAALTVSQISAFTAKKMANFSPEQLPYFTISQIAAIDVGALDSEQVSALSATQLAALGNNFSMLNSQAFEGLNADNLAGLSTTQLNALPSEKIAALKPSQLNALSSSQFSNLSSGALSAIAPETVKAIESSISETSYLTPIQLAALTPAKISSFTPLQLSTLTATQAAALKPAQIAALSAEKAGALSTAAIAALKPQVIKSMDLSALNSDDVAALSDRLIAYLKNDTLSPEAKAVYDTRVSSNATPTGTVTISGTSTQGQTLTADTSSLADLDGLGTFAYQWKKTIDGVTSDINVPTTQSSLPLTQAEVGAQISVVVSYTDGGGTVEIISSDTTTVVVDVNDTPVVTNGDITFNEDTVYIFQLSDFGSDPENALTSVTITSLPTLGSLKRNGIAVTVNTVITLADLSGGELTYTPPTNANGINYAQIGYTLTDSGNLTTMGTLALNVTPVNDVPIVIPNLLTNGDAELGNLTGWIAVNGGSPWLSLGSNHWEWANQHSGNYGFLGSYSAGSLTQEVDLIAKGYSAIYLDSSPTFNFGVYVLGCGNGSFADSYRIKVDLLDVNHVVIASYDSTQLAATNTWELKQNTFNSYGAGARYIKMQLLSVSDAGNWAGNYGVRFDDAFITSVSKPLILDEDTTKTFELSDFGSDIDNNLASVTITNLPVAGSLKLNGSDVIIDTNNIIPIAQISQLTYTPPTDANGVNYTTIGYTLTDTENSTASGTLVLNVTSVNDAPTLTIDGASQIGQSLTANLTDIDGLPDVGSISYQWKANGSEISGATSSSYTLTQSELNKVITVTASYIDLGGTTENVTSAATATITPPLPTFNGSLDNTPIFSGTPVILDSTVTIFDTELAALDSGYGDYVGATLTLKRQGVANSADIFGVGGDFFVLNGILYYTEVALGTFSQTNGVLTINFTIDSYYNNSYASQDNVNALLSSINYQNTSFQSGTVPIEWIFNDGSGGTVTEVINVAVEFPPNELPVFSGFNTTPVDFTQGGSAVILNATASVSDADLTTNSNYSGATLTLQRQGGAVTTDAFGSFGDSFYFDSWDNTIWFWDNSMESDFLIAAYTQTNGVLTISFNQNATQSRVNALLSELTYQNYSQTDNEVIIKWTFNDGFGGTDTEVTNVTIMPNSDDFFVIGELSETDENTLGVYFDTYELTDFSNDDLVTIALNAAFDGYLQIVRNGNVIANGSNYTYTYQTGDLIYVTSHDSGETGQYALTANKQVSPPTTPQTYSGNTYILSNNTTWQEAENQAAFLGGHLVTVNDQTKQDWLISTYGGSELFWIGLTDKETEGTFNWISNNQTAWIGTGLNGQATAGSYTNWNVDNYGNYEPNNSDNEDYTVMNWDYPGKWNDWGVDNAVRGIIEIPFLNTAPSATNLNAPETYTEDTVLNLTDIVVTDTDSANVIATLTLSNPAAGSLTSGLLASITGVWTASGSISEVNTLLAGLTFVPTVNFNDDFTIATSVSDGIAPAITGSKNFTGIAVNDEPEIPTIVSLMTTDITPTITGTIGTTVLGSDTFTVTINSVEYTVGDGNLSVDSTNWTLTIPAENALSSNTYDVTAARNDVDDFTSSELIILIG